MSIQDIPLDKITAADLERLVAMQVTESLTLDYKRDSYDPGNDGNSEYLKDISSFANTMGGDIVIGLKEKDGAADEIVGFHGNVDGELLRLEQAASNGIEPRLANLKIRTIHTNAGPVIVIRVGRSYMPPHRVVARGRNSFWARAGTAKYEPNVEQLRQLFNNGPHVGERIRTFHLDRLVKISAGETPVPMRDSGKLAIHVVAIPAFTDGRLADIWRILEKGTHLPLPPDEVRLPRKPAVNFDGFVNYTQSDPTQRSAYVHFFRNGTIEGVAELGTHQEGNSLLVGAPFTRLVIETVRQYVAVLSSYEAGLPISIYLSICNARKTVNRYDVPGGGYSETRPAGREILAVPEILLNEADPDISALMLPAFDMLWNAFGRERCDAYDAAGRWRGEGGVP
ncbi:hypothetical protein B5K05_13200 [Rhizobium phaseoli]|nr:hypothetical protein B5K04_13175 [Rhizobium phaseoli]RDJ14086.1 hypothetical protein B5K05_13200 [Rhizobium phaseoli]